MSDLPHNMGLVLIPMLTVVGAITVAAIVGLVITHLIWGDRP